MKKTENLVFWEEKPNRDQALDRVYAFIEALSEKDLTKAGQFVMLSEPAAFEEKLRKSLEQYITNWYEDDEAGGIQGDLLEHLTYPGEMDEESVQPEFEGRSFFLEDQETFSIHLSFKKKATNLQFYFTVCEQDALFFVKFQKIIENPNLPSMDF